MAVCQSFSETEAIAAAYRVCYNYHTIYETVLPKNI